MLPFHCLSKADLENIIAQISRYDLQREIVCPALKPPKVPRQNRTCRYCDAKDVPGQKRWKEAHLIPDFLGNSTLVGYDECSACNQYFSNLETNLAAFLGLSRAVNQQKGKNGVPKFKSADDKVVIIGDELWYGRRVIRIERKDPQDGSFIIDKDKGICKVEVKKATYIPLLAYKALIKIAFGLMPESELQYYPEVRNFLMTDKLDQSLAGTCCVNKITYPFKTGTKSPYLLIFKKKDPLDDTPTHMFFFGWRNYLFQFWFWYHENDIVNFAKKRFDAAVFPPFSFVPIDRFIHQALLQMGSLEKLKGEKEIVSLVYDPSTPMTGYDPVTQQEIDLPFDPDTIKGLYISDDDDFWLPIKQS